jgi:hypothetical protein
MGWTGVEIQAAWCVDAKKEEGHLDGRIWWERNAGKHEAATKIVQSMRPTPSYSSP